MADSTSVTPNDFGAIVEAACLAHDIGNPPFGHSGEISIADFWSKDDIKSVYRPYFISLEREPTNIKKLKIEGLTEKHWQDLSDFEGNAMGFRIINNPHYSGFNLTFSTLAAYTKYPHESSVNNELSDPILCCTLIPKEKNNIKRDSQKKYGFFQSEKNLFRIIAEQCGLIYLGDKENYCWCRHPLSF